MTDVPMFDIDGTEHRPADHAHTEHGCYFCQNRTLSAAAMAGADASYGAANGRFLSVFTRELVMMAAAGLPFTSVDVLLRVRAMGYETREARAIGSIMRRAQGNGMIRPTGAYVASADKAHHNAPKREWIGTL